MGETETVDFDAIDSDHRPNGQFREGNTATLKHGGRAALNALTAGKPFTGLARLVQEEVEADLETQGRPALVKELAVRLHTASRLYWTAIQHAADKGDLKLLDGYVARFGWLAQAALRAWMQDRRENPDDPNVLDYETILAAAAQKAGDDGNS